jgi:hypothetical protein
MEQNRGMQSSIINDQDLQDAIAKLEEDEEKEKEKSNEI